LAIRSPGRRWPTAFLEGKAECFCGELKVKMWHGLTSDGRLDASASHASVGYERTIFKLVAICCR
jgi:hypothetical protein